MSRRSQIRWALPLLVCTGFGGVTTLLLTLLYAGCAMLAKGFATTSSASQPDLNTGPMEAYDVLFGAVLVLGSFIGMVLGVIVVVRIYRILP